MPIAIERVAPDGMPQMREMHTDLVGTSGMKFAFHFRAQLALLQDTIIGPGGAAAFRIFRHPHFFAMDRMTPDGAATFACDAPEKLPQQSAR